MYHTDINDNVQHPRINRNSDASLGTRPNISSDSISALKKKRAKFAILDFMQATLRKHNVLNRKKSNVHRACTCMRRMNGKMVDGKYKVNRSMEIWHDSKTASFRGLRTCASVWACPICAERIAVQRAEEIKRAIEWAADNGKLVFMLTVTASHSRKDKLMALRQRVQKAWGHFTGGSVWQSMKKKMGVEQWIASREVTRGELNGWHPHIHVLLFFDPDKLYDYEHKSGETVLHKLKKRWMWSCHLSELHCTYERGADLAAIGDVGDSYLTKMGVTHRSTVDPSHELTANRRKGKSQWDLLQRAYNGCEKSSRLFAEFARDMSGAKWITWSRGFKDLLTIEEKTDEELASSEEKLEASLLTMVDREWWTVICRAGARGDLLSYASKNPSAESVWGYIWQIGVAYYRNHHDGDFKLRLLQDHTNYKRPKSEEILAHPIKAPPKQLMLINPEEFRYE